MNNMAFVSRHAPTQEQASLAAGKNFNLVHVGDMDAFSVDASDIRAKGEFTAVAVVHPAAAMRLASEYVIGVFENSMRPVEGGAPTFEAKALHLYDSRMTCTS